MNRTAETLAIGQDRQSALGLGLRGAGIVLAGSLFVAACAHVAIPLFFTPVPITLQPFAVLLLGLLMGPRMAFATTVAYLLEGAAGLPVFTPSGPGGVAQLLGLTGGYLFSYPLVAPLVSVLWRRVHRSFANALWITAAGSMATLIMGAIWFGMGKHLAPGVVLSEAVLPFLPGDGLKVTAAAGIAAGMARWRRQ